MKRKNFLAEQIEQSRYFTKKLLKDLPAGKWYETPEMLNTNIAWQVGHIMMSQYIHCIAVITAEQPELIRKIPFHDYVKLYIMGKEPARKGPEPEVLVQHLDEMHATAMNILEKLSEEELDAPLEAVPNFKHPVASTKYEALAFSFKHEMWHVGQLSMLKRILGIPMQWMADDAAENRQ